MPLPPPLVITTARRAGRGKRKVRLPKARGRPESRRVGVGMRTARALLPAAADLVTRSPGLRLQESKRAAANGGQTNAVRLGSAASSRSRSCAPGRALRMGMVREGCYSASGRGGRRTSEPTKCCRR